jgi:FHA domain
MSTTYTCDTCGSESATSDYCDTCGAAIADPAGSTGPGSGGTAGGGPAADPAVPPAAQAGGTAATCYFCGAPRSADDVFCEVCGLDFMSGQMPAVADPTPVPPADPTPVPVAPGPPSGAPDAADVPSGGPPSVGTPPAAGTTVLPQAGTGWTAVVGADRAFFDGNVTAGVVAFPAAITPREVLLAGDEMSIGRRSESKGYFPDIDLSSPVDDPAVSRRHAVLQRQPDGSWAVLDASSTNGTWINDEDEPIAHGVPRPLRDGDRLLLGAFTCITIRRDSPPASP